MNFHHTHHHHRNEEEEENTPNIYPPPGSNPFHHHQPPPPPQPQPPFYGAPHQPPPPPQPYDPVPQVFHTSHVTAGHHGPEHSSFNHGYPPPPSAPPHAPHEATSVHHVSHETRFEPHHENFSSSSSSVTVHHVSHSKHSELSNRPTVKVVTKANPDFSLTIRHGKVILARSDPRDEYQHWYKDEKYSTKVKDEEGCPAFSLVNKVTGEAIKHSIGETHPVRLVPYKPDYLDESVLWTESKDLGDGHRAIRMVNNIHLNVDAYHGDKQSGGVHDGTTIVLWKWNKGENQRWKIVPYCFVKEIVKIEKT